MSEPDDIEKLLREIDAMNAGGGKSAPVPAVPQGKEVESTDAAKSGAGAGAGGRVAWAGTTAIGGFFAGGLAGAIVPFVGSGSAAVGAAIGAAIVAALSGPPGWFSRD